MEIFFTWAIRGGRDNQPQFEYILENLKKYGNISSEQVALSSMSEYGETWLSGKEILQREKRKIEASNIVFSEVTKPSLWVGYLIGYATSLGKRVIALYNEKNTLKLSAIIKWDEKVEIYTYKDKKDIEIIFEKIFS